MTHTCNEITMMGELYDFKSKQENYQIKGRREAIDNVLYDDTLELWYVDNGTYITAIQYCPFCGTKLAQVVV